MPKKILYGLIILLVLFVLLFPYKTVDIPEWSITVIDIRGIPAPNVRIRQIWSHSKDINEEDQITDTEGNVTFQARISNKPVLFRVIIRIFGCIEYIIMPHGSSIEPHSSVFPVDRGHTNILNYPNKQGSLEKVLVLSD